MAALLHARRHALCRGRGGAAGTAVLLHGLLGGVHAWDGVARELRGAATVRSAVALDLLGFGRSPWPSGDYTVQRHVEALLRAVEEHAPESEGPLHLAGHSLGGALALSLAAALPPGRVASLTLLSPAVFPGSAAEAELHLREASVSGLWLRFPTLSRVVCAAVCQNRAVFDHVLPHLAPGYPREVVRDYMKHSHNSVDSTTRLCILDPSVYDGAVREMRRRLDAGVGPAAVRVVQPPGDATVPPACGRALARALGPRAELVETDALDGGHGYPVVAPAETARLLLFSGHQ